MLQCAHIWRSSIAITFFVGTSNNTDDNKLQLLRTNNWEVETNKLMRDENLYPVQSDIFPVI